MTQDNSDWLVVFYLTGHILCYTSRCLCMVWFGSQFLGHSSKGLLGTKITCLNGGVLIYSTLIHSIRISTWLILFNIPALLLSMYNNWALYGNYLSILSCLPCTRTWTSMSKLSDTMVRANTYFTLPVTLRDTSSNICLCALHQHPVDSAAPEIVARISVL